MVSVISPAPLHILFVEDDATIVPPKQEEKLLTIQQEKCMTIEQQTEEIYLLMNEFSQDFEVDNSPPLSLIDELIFKLEVLHRERSS